MIEFGRVLIVDDSAMMRSVVRKSLAMAKVSATEIVEADNGSKALHLVRTSRFDIMFCDLNMPEMTGDEVIEMLSCQSMVPVPPIVVVSSEASSERMDRLNPKHIVGVLRKPFTPEKLVSLFNDAKCFIAKELV